MNNKLKSTIIAMLGVAFLAACSTNQTADQSENQTHQSATDQTDKNQSDAPAQIKDVVLNAILPYYDQLQQALVKEDINKAKEAALLVEEGSGKLSEGTALKAAATAIIKANTIAEQREAFADLSKHYINLIKNSGIEAGEFYVAHCPMAFNQAGADWLTENKSSLKNPYFGERMLTCGSITETLH